MRLKCAFAPRKVKNCKVCPKRMSCDIITFFEDLPTSSFMRMEDET